MCVVEVEDFVLYELKATQSLNLSYNGFLTKRENA